MNAHLSSPGFQSKRSHPARAARAGTPACAAISQRFQRYPGKLFQIRRTSPLNRRSQFFWCRKTPVHAVDFLDGQSQLLQLLAKTNRWVLCNWKCSVGCRVEQVSLKQNLLLRQIRHQDFFCMRIRSNVVQLHDVFVVLKNSLLVRDRLNSQFLTG